jgi:hypothetical protein
MKPETKKIARIAAGAVLALCALLLLASFVYACIRDAGLPAFTLEKKYVTAPMAVIMWLCILGTGAPAALLLLKAFPKPAAPGEGGEKDGGGQ